MLVILQIARKSSQNMANYKVFLTSWDDFFQELRGKIFKKFQYFLILYLAKHNYLMFNPEVLLNLEGFGWKKYSISI